MTAAPLEHPVLGRELERVRAIMAERVRCGNRELQRCVDDQLAHPGKMLRSAMTLLSAHAVRQAKAGDADWRADDGVLRVAAAIETMHLATLVHDDVIDGAGVRRGQPTVYASHGARMAILLGDLLFSAAFQMVSDLADPGHTQRLAKAVRAISESEILQMNRIDPEKPAIRQYLHQIIGKTAVLFAVSCRAGAELAGGGAMEQQSLQRAGYSLGMAFQIVDDILDFDENDAVSGKTPGRDLQLGLLTLPVLIALRNMRRNGGAGAELAAVLKRDRPGRSDVQEVRNLVRRWNGFAEARAWVGRYTDRATREMGRLAGGEALGLLKGLAVDLSLRVS